MRHQNYQYNIQGFGLLNFSRESAEINKILLVGIGYFLL